MTTTDEKEWKKDEIPPIALPLPGFQYQHTPDPPGAGNREQDRGMVGRDDLLAELSSVLSKTQGSRGSYLIAGFRGSGKTSIINKALDLYKGTSDHLAWLPGDPRNELICEDEFQYLITEEKKKQEEISSTSETSETSETIEPIQPHCESLSKHIQKIIDDTITIIEKKTIKLFQDFNRIKLAHHTRTLIYRIKQKKLRKRLLNPLIHVQVNLATEKSLDARTVLFNVSFLLHQELKRIERKTILRRSYTIAAFIAIFYLASASIIFLADYKLIYPFGNNTLDSSGLLQPISNLLSIILSSIGGILRSLSTLLFGNQDTDITIQILRAGPLADLNSFFFGMLLPLYLSYIAYSRLLLTPSKIIRRLEGLIKRGRRTEEMDQGLTTGAGLRIGKRYTTPPLDAQQIEAELLDILADCRRIPRLFGRPDIVFVFDELDKISGTRIHDVQSAPSNQTFSSRPNNSTAFEGIADFPTWTTREIYKRKERVDELLSTIKNFITEGEARFFFIAGREMLDSYQSELGSASSLYESLFNKVFEVPSLLTDASIRKPQRERISRLTEAFVCRRIMSPSTATYIWHCYNTKNKKYPQKNAHLYRYNLQYEPYRLRTVYHWLCSRGVEQYEARRIVFMLRHFVHFLVLHSWGNCKRLNSLFEHFIKPSNIANPDTKSDRQKLGESDSESDNLVLQFGRMDQQRIMLASNLYVLLHHHFRRQHSSGADKLIVSVFAALQYLLKFHHFPFSRSQLDRMDEVLSIHRSPELNSAIDTLLTVVLRPHVRLIRNGLSRYRFIHGFEQEVRYIARISDIESAAFNFSLDANAGVKLHYQELLRRAEHRSQQWNAEPYIGTSTIADINITLGDLLTQEESFDQAAVHFQEAADILSPRISSSRSDVALEAKVLLQYIEALLKLGDVNERRQRYERAAAAYTTAQEVASLLLRSNQKDSFTITEDSNIANQYLREAIRRGDSKWDILKQPVWALKYLNLKRSPNPWLEHSDPEPDPFYECRRGLQYGMRTSDAVFHYRAGQLAFFYGQHSSSSYHFANAITCSRNAPKRESVNDERETYIGGYAALNAAENLIVGFMQEQHKKIHKSLLKSNTSKSENLKEAINSYMTRLSELLSTMREIENEAEISNHPPAEPGALNS
ncbi:ATP-binding protein [Thiorhodococcus fuscus]|uniref:ATP-binding protein n=1 Tax=Thiorhodococcus fuscus TaxID=527200 RepID=A0ABW4YDJ8_9GAMM